MKKKQRKNIKIILRLEFKNTLQIVDKLIDRYGSISFFDIKILNQLLSSITRLESTRERVIHLKDDSKKEEVLSCINATIIYHSDIMALENNAFEKEKIQATPTAWNKEYFKGQRLIFATKSVDIKRKIQDMINYFEK